MTLCDLQGPARNHTCVQRLAQGLCGQGELCPLCAQRYMAALDRHCPEPLAWHARLTDRATRRG